MINFPRALKARQNAMWSSFNDKYLRAVPPRGFFLIHPPDVSRLATFGSRLCREIKT
jgi:hypothetical protein